MKKAVYPGSFDPITNGHLDIIKRAAEIFDEVCVAVISNPDKNAYFSLEERLQMLKEAAKDIKKVKVDYFDGLLVDYAKHKGFEAIIRGLRAVSDFDYEFQMALTNRQMNPKIETVFLMTDYKYSYLSSSIVKQIAHFGGDVHNLVPENVAERLKKS
ncbi:pantetheine-phosphate adenylyltransferase [candidate division WOR-1 bacterium RIFOXYD2_FULL_36_8]|uniref:Phosphopantetheine adenylyltransferase n=1 Tax=candidate division WOR-1 bacterium RIFOXYB2_FULL_36_35 TaxID=1802578 RepID=A0A1F4RZF3_UNCSA|nr:MAG: pantetheine-phosphate adenylyltransferase [candidate division WOR-1 bacterium RIFOXYA2_FULL_36_21]OGC13566.1 MAG: pantetheine-phosphate adenylyltransferase [candidate division WOR-1 bacterium RIFOXYB2_FULL_36_35]OGC14223.1 MAG: pantetheine-phosphate adenylyltransferase [candidate division WOR-1 bacterium RIFOXYA12_FULL_36_13]OGC38936.1 MAG: pantetheine-phosphate adenylyltransferase [candidate division WOR-1 bacterium RIFOXYD2_FULL_36_8]